MPDIIQVAAFCAVDGEAPAACAGNPAAVVLFDGGYVFAGPDIVWPSTDFLSNMASRLAQPAAVFLIHADAGSKSSPASFYTRFFTSSGDELPLCGHASLAAAHALWTTPGVLPTGATTTILLPASPGVSPVELRRLGAGDYQVRLAAQVPTIILSSSTSPVSAADLAAALGGFEGAFVAATTPAGDVIIRINDASSSIDFTSIKPNPTKINALFPSARIVSITAAYVGESRAQVQAADVVSRCFARGTEDPVCAAAHAGLACYWASQVDFSPCEKSSLRAWQASPRGGLLIAAIDRGANGGPEWVRLRGACLTIIDEKTIKANEHAQLNARLGLVAALKAEAAELPIAK